MSEGPPWRVLGQRQASRQLRRLPADVLHRIAAALDEIGRTPYAVEPLTSFAYRKWRVGDWRIIDA